MLFLLMWACGPDLPSGWEDAEPVRSLVQTECGDHPYDPFESTVAADLSGDPLIVDVGNAHFRCAQDVQGFWRSDGEDVSVLVQPIDMNPRMVAGCDCLYDLVIELDAVDASSVEVFRRWDDLNDDNEPILLGKVN